VAKEPKPFTPGQERFGKAFIRVVSRVNAWLFRRTKGRWGATMPGSSGAPVCLVTTTGVKSGLPRTVALVYLRQGDDVVVVASLGGMSENPQWYGNLVADPKVTVEIGAEKMAMIAHTATPDEKARLWPELVDLYKGYADYQARTEREIPVVICRPEPA
jgi:deazaflavin-dependent oxidoreductase (nitroreductase family)